MNEGLFASDDAEDLGRGLVEAGRLAAAFSGELQGLRGSLGEATRDLGALERGFAGGLRRALGDLATDGGRLSDALATLGRSMADTVYAAALKPVTDHLGGLLAQGLSGLSAGGAAPFAAARVMPFAKGGVVTRATAFPLRGATGLMGEAGPEAIMPLARGPDGRLGVRAQGAASAPQVTINISTLDVAGFRRSQSQIAAEMARALGRGARNR